MRIEKGLTYPESNAERISMSGANAQDIVVTQPLIVKSLPRPARRLAFASAHPFVATRLF